MKALALITLSVCALSVKAAEPYPTGLELGYLAAATADMSTTLDIKNHSNMQEMNPILGTHPSDARIVAYFVTTDALHALVTYGLIQGDVPTPIVHGWEYVTIGVEVCAAAHNYHAGLRFKF